MITTNSYLLSVLKLLWRGALTGVHVDISELRLVKLSRLHVLHGGCPHLNFENPNGAPDPLQGPLRGPLAKSQQQAHRDWFSTLNVL